jgi:hypothetical protein
VGASATSFPLSKHTGGGDTAPAFSGLCVCYSSMGSGSSPLSCAVFLPPPLLQVFLLLITGQCCCSCQLPCLFTAHVRSGSSPLSCGVFLPPPLSQAFPLLVAGRAPPTPTSPAYLFTVLGRIPLPASLALIVPHLLSHMSLLFLLLITPFLFLLPVEVGLSRKLCCSGPGLSVGVPRYR